MQKNLAEAQFLQLFEMYMKYTIFGMPCKLSELMLKSLTFAAHSQPVHANQKKRHEMIHRANKQTNKQTLQTNL